MPQFAFGIGALVATPNAGNLAPNPTPIQFGTMQDVQVQIKGSIKKLVGQRQFPDAAARAAVSITWKAKTAQILGKLYNDIFFGLTQNPANKMELVSIDEGPTAIPTTPFTITVTNAATFFQDLGVKNAANGNPFTKVASAPAAGQYSVNAATGVYTFSSADQMAGISVKITYSYQSAAGGGNTSHITNQLMGFQPFFSLWLTQPYNGLQSNMLLYSCLAGDINWQAKNEDFTVPEIGGEAFADGSGNVLDFYESN